MTSNNRARTREIRAQMAASGEKYTTVARQSRPASNLRAVCFGCHKDIPAGGGVIHVLHADIAWRERALASVRERRESRVRDGEIRVTASMFTADEMVAEALRKAEWQVHCDDCNPHNSDGCSGCYWFAVERCFTWAQLTEWTVHLSEKSWLRETDWMGHCTRRSAFPGRRV